MISKRIKPQLTNLITKEVNPKNVEIESIDASTSNNLIITGTIDGYHQTISKPLPESSSCLCKIDNIDSKNIQLTDYFHPFWKKNLVLLGTNIELTDYCRKCPQFKECLNLFFDKITQQRRMLT